MRFICLNSGLLSFILRMVTRISKESLCRKGKAREPKTKIRLLGADPDQKGRCKEHSWMGAGWGWGSQPARSTWGLWVCSQSLGHSLTVRGVRMSAKKRTAPHPGLGLGGAEGSVCCPAERRRGAGRVEEHSPAQQRPGRSGTPAAKDRSARKNKTPAVVETSQNVLTLSKVHERNARIAESEMLLGFIWFSGVSNFSFLSFTAIRQSALGSCLGWTQSRPIFWLPCL